jgi:alpha-amylase
MQTSTAADGMLVSDHMLYLHTTTLSFLQARKRNNILSTSTCDILCAEGDLYVADIGDRLRVKLGPRMDMGSWAPNKEEWSKVVCGKDFCVWERRQ